LDGCYIDPEYRFYILFLIANFEKRQVKLLIESDIFSEYIQRRTQILQNPESFLEKIDT
jgi:hypothetical protein